MIFTEVYDDLFNRELYHDGVWYVQCISADLRMGRGIAGQFNDHFDMKRKLMEKFRIEDTINAFRHQKAEVIFIKEAPVFNLVTKEHYWDKPNLGSMCEALKLLRFYCGVFGIKELLMPKIGCGLDKLEWKSVKKIIFSVFENTDMKITVCKLREVV